MNSSTSIIRIPAASRASARALPRLLERVEFRAPAAPAKARVSAPRPTAPGAEAAEPAEARLIRLHL